MSDVSKKLVVFRDHSDEPEANAPAADRIVSGNPSNLTWNVEEDGDGLYAGIWESAPGEWRVDYTEWEFCHLVAGLSVLTDENGEAVTLRAGDAFVIRPGFKGTWRVVETTRKHYVIKV